MTKALIIVDMQKDFMDEGPLAVPKAQALVPLINDLMTNFKIIIASKDWHPSNHQSFATLYPEKKPGDLVSINGIDQVLWPVHCVQHTEGAEFVYGLDSNKISYVVLKGIDPAVDSYSAFYDNAHKRATTLHEHLRSHGIDELYICGVATDYCVKYTVLDACALGYRVFIIEEACAGIDLAPGDIQKAKDLMKKAGAQFI